MTRSDDHALLQMVEHLPTPIHVYACERSEAGPTLRLVVANAAARQLDDVVQHELLARHGVALTELCDRVASSQESTSLGEVLLNDDVDFPRVLRIDAFPLADYVGVSLVDVSELVTLRHRVCAFQAAIDAVPEILFVKGQDKRYIVSNLTAAEGAGETTASVVGKRDRDLFPPELAQVIDEVDDRVIAGRETVTVEEQVQNPELGTRILQSKRVPIRGEDDAPRFLVGWIRDLTEHHDTMTALAKTQTELQNTIEALSTPVLRIRRGVLVVPLIGVMSSSRGEQFMDTLLEGIRRHRARIIIIDITGIHNVDSDVASRLMSATRAAALLGTECVLVGVGPLVANSLVGLGIDFGMIRIHRDLEAGVNYALRRC